MTDTIKEEALRLYEAEAMLEVYKYALGLN
jgi:uncharacterized protein (UPF0335 family)